ncbi:prephenate dehydratase [Parvularcula lutaonensis]|uniref:prephenate dehydratase n=1 Tax=Parvularcula lutaonensis TaxID=491923 RepID=A0ABV7M9D6_9PROT|nr:prephenate dehydratase [Parvularcula lutaonensis]GGY46892.1 prephenate dehydratase [Parvularcula lutaonensis]
MAKIAYQGEPGAFSELCCAAFAPAYEPVAFPTFDQVFQAVTAGECQSAMVPVENSLAGRVDDVYRLLPDRQVAAVAEHFLPVHMQLMALPDADPAKIRTVRSHPMALSQCRRFIRERGYLPEAARDTAGSARELRDNPDPTVAVIAPRGAAERYGLKIIQPDCQDEDRNVTRFLRLVPEEGVVWPKRSPVPMLTSFVFRVRNIPAALYKALGGFATNGVNMTKLESYQEDHSFEATRFQAEAQGHPDDPAMARALEELEYFTTDRKVIGVFAADPYRVSREA